MERKYIRETEHRLLLLYTLKELGPVTSLQLLQAMTETGHMNYITMQLALSDMEQQGHIAMRAHPSGSLIEVTEEGQYLLDSFRRQIPSSKRLAIDEHAADWRSRFLTEQMAPAQSFTLPDGRMCIHLQLLDSAATLLDLLLYLPAGDSINLVSERWRACMQNAYMEVLNRLTTGYDPDVPAGGASDAVRQCGPDDWLLSLTDSAASPTINLMLSLQDEQLAHYCAARWPDACGALYQSLLTLLRGALD